MTDPGFPRQTDIILSNFSPKFQENEKMDGVGAVDVTSALPLNLPMELRAIVNFYCPQWSCGKVIFLQTCVKNSIHRGGVCLSACWDTPLGQTPPGQTPPRQAPPWTDLPGQTLPGQTPRPPPEPLQRTVRILLEFFLVKQYYLFVNIFIYLLHGVYSWRKWSSLFIVLHFW